MSLQQPSSPLSRADPSPATGPTRWHGLRALRHRNFRLFWLGQLVSLTGTWMQTVAQSWLIFELTNDPIALGLVTAAQYLPVLLLSLFAGVFADAIPKRRALIGTQAAAATVAAVLAGLLLFGLIEVWHVFAMAICLGIINAFDMPIRQSFVVEMVGREDLPNAVALNSALFNGTRIVGPAIAGLLVATIGVTMCFTLNSASYIGVIAGLLMMRTEQLRTPPPVRFGRNLRSVVHQLAEGLSFIKASPPILLSLLMLGSVSTVALNFQVLGPLLASDVLGGGADTFGFLMAGSGIGSMLSALWVAFGHGPTRRLLFGGALVVGVSLAGLAVSRLLPISLVLMLTTGWGTIAVATTTNTLIQLATPDQLRGRVMSVYATVFIGAVPLGGLTGGAIAGAAGVAAAYALGGVAILLMILAAMVWVRRTGAGWPALETGGG